MKNLNTKVLMFDLDGTLINHECIMSPLMVQTLKELKNRGYCLCLNSGRPYPMSFKVLKQFHVEDCFDYIFGCNGAEYYDPELKEVVMLKSLNPQTIQDISAMTQDLKMLICLITKDYLYVDRDLKTEMADFYARTRNVQIKTIDFNTLDHPWAKCLGMIDDEDVLKAQALASSLKDERYDAYFSNKNLLEFVPKGVQKYNAVEKLMTLIPDLKADEIISFGDADNDLPMLKKTNGVLMGNAKNELHDLFVTKTLSVDEDGVYHYLNKEGFFEE